MNHSNEPNLNAYLHNSCLIQNQNFYAGSIISSQYHLIEIVRNINTHFCKLNTNVDHYENTTHDLRVKFSDLMVKLDAIKHLIDERDEQIIFSNEKTYDDTALSCGYSSISNISDVTSESSLKVEKEHKDGKRSLDRQRLFNKYVKNEVKREFGEDFLIHSQVRDLDFEVMQSIRTKAIEKYLPNKASHKEAWHNAMNSLRQVRHQKKKKVKLI